MRNITYINGVEGVASASTATVNIPIDRRYHALKLFVGATGATLATDIVDKVRLFVNGVVMRDLTPAQIIGIATLNGLTPATGEIPIYFSEPWRATVLGEESTSWDLFGQSKCTLEVVFKTVTAPTLQVQAAYDYARNKDGEKFFLAIIKQLNQGYNAPSGTFDIVTIPTSFPIQRLELQMASNTINSVEVYRGSEKIHEGTAAQNARFLADYGLVASAFTFPIVFDYEQQISSPLIVANQGDLLVRPTTSGAALLTVTIESRAPGYI